MSKLVDYIRKNAIEVDRKSSECESDMIFFGVKKSIEAKKEELIELIKSHKGDFCEIDFFDKSEHNYLQVGGWIGDQGLALMLMGLGASLGIWKLLTPKTILGKFIDDEMCNKMAGMGMISVQVIKKKD